MITLSVYEYQTIQLVYRHLLEYMPEKRCDEVDMWRQSLPLGNRIARNVLVLRVRSKVNGEEHEYMAPIWPE